MAAGLARASAVVITYLDVPAAMKVLDLGCGDGSLDFYQQVSHVFGPRLCIALMDEAQVTQVMGVTEGMRDVLIREVGAVVVVDDDACALGQDVNGIQRLRTPFRVQFIMRQVCGAGRMQPGQLPTHSGASLIVVGDRFVPSQLLLHLLIDRRHLSRSVQPGCHHRAFTDRLRIQVSHDLSHPLQ